MNKINIFVSSTCYDLAQIRTDLKQFIINLGHTPILSEEHDFPINPSKSNTENCINAVKEKADIFILIIGNRYGCTSDNGKSITNTEFLTAKTKGIPIYTFTLKSMLNILPIWDKNKDADYSSFVDSPLVFSFIQDVRSNSGIWNFGFEHAQDIMDILKVQLSYLFNESLSLKRKLNALGHNDLLTKISNKAIQILLEKKDYYEIRFFFQCLYDEILKFKDLRNNYNYSIILTTSNHKIERYSEYLSWGSLKYEQISRIIEAFNTVFKKMYPFYYADEGIESDLEGLYYAARTYGRLYSSLLEWSIDALSLVVKEEYSNSKILLAKLSEEIIQQIEKFPCDSLKLLDDIDDRFRKGEHIEDVQIILTLTINSEISEQYKKELDRLLDLVKDGIID